jgi:hypothetical protein
MIIQINRLEESFMKKKMRWVKLGSGSYNEVFYTKESDALKSTHDYSGPVVVKLRHDPTDLTDAPDRIKRLTNEINPKQPIDIVDFNVSDDQEKEKRSGSAIVTVYYPNKVPHNADTDEKVAKAILDIYRRTRRIVIDGCIHGNFREHEGQYICIDLGMAWRRGSVISDLERKRYNNLQSNSLKYFFYRAENVKGRLKSSAMVQNLFYLEKQLLQEIKDVKDIKDDYLTYDVVMSLTFYRKNKLKINENFLQVSERREIIPLVIKLFPQLINKETLQSLTDNSSIAAFRKAILAAYKYINSTRFGFFRTHGKEGINRTEEFVKELLKLSNPTEESIKQCMRNWLAGTNIHRSSRSSFAYESGVLIQPKNPGLFSSKTKTISEKLEREKVLTQMLKK